MSTNIYSRLCEILEIESNNPISDDVFNQLPDNLVRFNPEIAREEALVRNSIKLTCSKCGIFGQGVNMKRWHFDNCKTKFKNCEQCGDVIPRQGIKDYLYQQKKYCDRKCYMESKKGIPPIEMTDEVKQKISDSWKRWRELRTN